MNINDTVKKIHENAKNKGFWDVDPSPLAGRLMLVVSELSEAMEADRSGQPLFYRQEDGKPDGVAVEIVDAVIRCFDILGDMAEKDNIDIEYIIDQKMQYNKESRGKLHGRKY